MNLEQRLEIIFYDDMGSTIVTNGFMHIEKIVEKGIKTIFIEGKLKGSTMVTTGPMALRSLSFLVLT